MSDKPTYEALEARIGQLEKEIAEEKTRSAQLLQARKMEPMETLSGGISHDFNDILQEITGHAETLLQGKKPDNPDFFPLTAIYKSAEQGTRLIRQLLLFNRRVTARKKSLNINQALAQAEISLERVIPGTIEVMACPAPELWNVQADPVQIEQVILNLAIIGADAMPDGGKLKMETQNITLKTADFPDHMEPVPGDYVLLRVSDTGNAMAGEAVKKIFDRFFNTRTTGKETGGRLSPAYNIIKSHGGYIFCQSKAGLGTTFNIYLPALGQTAKGPAPLEPSLPPLGGRETILVVDDEKSIIDMTGKILNQFGYQVLTAANGQEALERHRQFPRKIDLVILDIGMPVMGGRECLRELLKLDPHVRVVFTSGYTDDASIAEYMASGAMGYIGKPYTVKDFLQRVRTVLDK